MGSRRGSVTSRRKIHTSFLGSIYLEGPKLHDPYQRRWSAREGRRWYYRFVCLCIVGAWALAFAKESSEPQARSQGWSADVSKWMWCLAEINGVQVFVVRLTVRLTKSGCRPLIRICGFQCFCPWNACLRHGNKAVVPPAVSLRFCRTPAFNRESSGIAANAARTALPTCVN